MHVIARKALEEFWQIHPSAKSSLEAWYKVISKSTFSDFNDVRDTFRSADYVNPYTIFDIGGNNFRVIAALHYNRQKIYVRHVFTHSEYDRWCKRNRSKGT